MFDFEHNIVKYHLKQNIDLYQPVINDVKRANSRKFSVTHKSLRIKFLSNEFEHDLSVIRFLSILPAWAFEGSLLRKVAGLVARFRYEGFGRIPGNPEGTFLDYDQYLGTG